MLIRVCPKCDAVFYKDVDNCFWCGTPTFQKEQKFGLPVKFVNKRKLKKYEKELIRRGIL